ncbi:AraC family transcriptional regulator, partial [Escherichia coli]|nr:AraC family transcriptional regulator [Escherichia coli]
MSLVCSVIFIQHAFNANILDKYYAFSYGELR